MTAGSAATTATVTIAGSIEARTQIDPNARVIIGHLGLQESAGGVVPSGGARESGRYKTADSVCSRAMNVGA